MDHLMADASGSFSKPLDLPELVGCVISHIKEPADVLRCACVNKLWNELALKRLYEGSMHDLCWRTPDVGSLNSLFVASPKRFAQNLRYTKCLTIAPTFTGIDDVYTNSPRSVCVETCRLWRDRKSLELLMPPGKEPTSLAIPFELLNQVIGDVSDLIFHQNLQSLIIDFNYCSDIMMNYSSASDHLTRKERPRLAALTLYRLDPEMIDCLCDLLETCDLKVFHIDQEEEYAELSEADMEHLLDYLWSHQNLEALALTLNVIGTQGADMYEGLEHAKGMTCWPKLKALYLNGIDEFWLKKLPTFENLRIIKIRDTALSWSSIHKSILHCRNLQVIEIEVGRGENPEICIIIARTCPLLRSFGVNCVIPSARPQTKMTRSQFSQLLQNLPHVEVLSLIFRVKMDGSTPQDLATSCPRLTTLQMRHSTLRLSLESLVECPPIRGLKHLEVKDIRIDKHDDQHMRPEGLESLGKECNRVFPKLRHVFARGFVYPMKGSYEESESDDEGSGNESSHDISDQSSDESPDEGSEMGLEDMEPEQYMKTLHEQYEIKKRLLSLLGCSGNFNLKGIKYAWQTNFEIETFGWPIVPMSVFMNPKQNYAKNVD